MRSRPTAAIELAEGVALSKRSFWRTTSASPSSAVVNRPPSPGSQKWSSSVSAMSIASSIQRASPVASPRRVKASSSAAWSAASAAWRAAACPSACHERRPAPVVAAQLVEQERAVVRCRVDPGRLAEQRAGLGERGDQQRVPLGEHLVVEPRPRPLLARVEQPLPQRARSPAAASSPRWASRLGIERAFEVAGGRDAVPLASPTSASAGPSTARTSSGVHVWNRPSWPWPSRRASRRPRREKKPPPGWRRSRSTYSIVSSTTWR